MLQASVNLDYIVALYLHPFPYAEPSPLLSSSQFVSDNVKRT